MSGHNPHGHLSQPNSSWNPLQIPSYIPRQPQLAHMSNERPLVRSPLTWHTPTQPTPPEAFYSFLSASHKNLELNPLLPSFVRGPPPFGSVDLTIQSARNSTTPSPRNLTSSPTDFGPHNKHQIPRSLTPNNTNSSSIAPGPGVIQSTGSVRDKFQGSYNGNNGEIPSSTGGIFTRDARQINNEISKMTARDTIEMTSGSNVPVELVKESSYSIAKCHVVPTSPKRLSPSRPPSIQNSTPVSPRSRSPLPLLPSTDAPTDIVKNHVIKSGNNINLTQKSASETILSESSPLSLALPSPTNVTSNEDSVDSIASKSRRKRKPNKTTRVSNDSDESINEKEKDHVLLQPIACSDQLKQDPITEKFEIPTALESKLTKDQIKTNETACQSKSVDKSQSTVAEEPHNSDTLILSSDTKSLANHIVKATSETDSAQSQTQPPIDVLNKNESNSPATIDRNNTKTNLKESSGLEKSEQISDSYNSHSDLDSPRKRCKRKADSDDIETIDKIAAMIASTNEEPITVESTLSSMEENTNAQSEKIEKQNNNCKIHDLTEILEMPITSGPEKEEAVHKNDEKEIEKENCFEEVENKLEEMFAGIVDEEPPPCVDQTIEMPSIDDPITSEVISELGLGQPSPHKSKTLSVSATSTVADEDDSLKTLNSLQKRPHSIKPDQTPPKKKRKIGKKSISNQKPIKTSKTLSSSSHVSKSSKSAEKMTVKEKIKEEPTVEYKGPFVQVKLNGTINVINAPIAEDIVEKQNKVKKSIHNHTNSDRKKIRGLHVSTLSTKYDADTTDTTWMCVFCKRGPHKFGLGDLFGPYIIMTTCEEFAFSQKDPIDDEFISKRTKADMFQKQINSMPIVPSMKSGQLSIVAAPAGTSTNKKKRKITDSPSSQQNLSHIDLHFDITEIYIGMTKVSDTSYEVWLHEDCAVWSSGVHVIGARIVGLQAAVWSSTRHKCSICSNNGAMICCLQRGCSEKAHIPCARTQNWTLDENEFKSLCEKHSFQVS